MNTLSVKITDNLHYIGVNDRETHLFENLWPLDNGISYNSYILTGEKTALLDTVKITKVDSFMFKIQSILKGRTLDYLVIHHMEPDHSGSIRAVLELHPGVQLVGNKKTGEFLKAFYGIGDRFIEVKEGDSLDLGNTKLDFYMTPMVHWPESMMSYERAGKILFSQDAFGGFGALNGPIFDDEINWDFYESETRRYYSNIVGKHSRQVQTAIGKLAGLDISMICPVHGPVWRGRPQKIVELYDRWSRFDTEPGVVIVYGSMYGNTAVMAEATARVLAEEGISDIKLYDVSKTHVSYIINEIWKYRGLVLGSCTYNNGLFPPMSHLVNLIRMNNLKNHVLGIFGSYSWSGGAVKALKEFAEASEFDLIDTVVEAKCAPTAADLDGCAAIARELARRLKGA